MHPSLSILPEPEAWSKGTLCEASGSPAHCAEDEMRFRCLLLMVSLAGRLL